MPFLGGRVAYPTPQGRLDTKSNQKPMDLGLNMSMKLHISPTSKLTQMGIMNQTLKASLGTSKKLEPIGMLFMMKSSNDIDAKLKPATCVDTLSTVGKCLRMNMNHG